MSAACAGQNLGMGRQTGARGEGRLSARVRDTVACVPAEALLPHAA
jgi:hypothetical protein